MPERVSLAEAFWVWLKIGLYSFGGPAGQIALMHKELVDKRKWLDEARFLHALNYCMLLPGPEAQQLATYIGWLMHRRLGGVIAGGLFVLPGFVAMFALSLLYARWAQLPLVSALFFGLKAAVLAVVVEAVLRIGKRALTRRVLMLVAGAAFVAIYLFAVPFPLVIVGAGLIGFVGSRLQPDAFPAPRPIADTGAHDTVVDAMAARGELAHTRPSAPRALAVGATLALVWAAPVLLVGALVGWRSTPFAEGVFFSKTAVVTFGGAYAVLAYIGQQAVEVYGWLRPGEMLDGLGLAETTPGPLIMVVQFVGFVGAWRNPGALSPLAAASLGAALTVWVTFVPCFLWIFTGAPYIESLRGNRTLHAALSSITAAVVGVILNLSLWFALHVVFASLDERRLGPLRLLVPRWASIDLAAAGLAALALLVALRWKPPLAVTLGGCAALGLAWKLLS